MGDALAGLVGVVDFQTQLVWPTIQQEITGL